MGALPGRRDACPLRQDGERSQVVSLPKRVEAILEMRRTVATSEWVFPALTKSGHIEPSTLKKRHQKACALAGIEHLPMHPCLTRWADHMDPYSLAHFAGHSSFVTTRRYVHPNLDTGRAAMERAQEAQGRHKNGHSGETAAVPSESESPVKN
jgi:integrase